MLIKLSVAGASGAFICLAVHLIGTLKKGMVTLDETNKTLAEVRNAVNGLSEEAEQLIHTANQLTSDVKGKIRTVDPLLESAHDVGEMLHNVTSSIKQVGAVFGAKRQQRTEISVNEPPVRIKGPLNINVK
ncbi:DUF948 domain-containing protein [Metabacillus sp. JX24]|uniref:DUF948 domain-containing protein n=1 Tax=Metabacillus sp. JX24 TaxID=3240759 RepID=UPI0030FD387A